MGSEFDKLSKFAIRCRLHHTAATRGTCCVSLQTTTQAPRRNVNDVYVSRTCLVCSGKHRGTLRLRQGFFKSLRHPMIKFLATHLFKVPIFQSHDSWLKMFSIRFCARQQQQSPTARSMMSVRLRSQSR
jgi:hypothetical protein